MSHVIPFTATFPDGSQVLITRYLFDDGHEYETVARREKSEHVWGPPVRVELAPSEREGNR